MKLNKVLFIFLFISLTTSYTCQAQEKQKLLILGDSLSAGYGIAQGKNWTDLLQKQLDESNIQVINASISGDTSANGLNRLPAALKKHQPSWVLIELGANDGLRGLPISHIKKNLEQIIKSSLEKDAEVFLMEIKIPFNYGKKYTQAFSRIYQQLAEQYNIMLLDFFLNNIALNRELMQTDGLHPNEKAQALISQYLWQKLKPYFLQAADKMGNSP